MLNEYQVSQIAQTENDSLIQLVNKILSDAIEKNASDIHIEPAEKNYRIRIRQDGILHELMQLNLQVASRVSSRIKLMAGLDISEKRLPQDGHFQLSFLSQQKIDFRISSCPTIYGEKIVIRILNSANLKIMLDDLGLMLPQKKLLIEALHQAEGMILVTGPTGSGKTVTLYSGLNLINKAQINISTIEDPIEIYMEGVNQININPKIGLTFATILRALLRQDPDVIMLGEIRDSETANIAVKAAQTGHLVLSSLHTKNTSESLIRLNTLGVPPYQISSAVKLIIAQRLVRLLCQFCKKPTETIKNLESSITYIANLSGCSHCVKGYKNRIGIFEIMPVSKVLQKLILAQTSALQLEKQAIKEGMLTLAQVGLEKILKGETSLEEMNRVL